MRTHFLGKESETQKNSGHRGFWLLLLVVGLCPLSAFAQCDTSWTGAATGNWNVPGNWSAGVPTSNTNTCISTANSIVTLNIIGAGTADLTLGSTDTLSFGNETQLTVSGSAISNSGTISLNSTGVPTELVMGAANVTLSGTGTVNMSNNANNYITGSAPANTLTNQSTIQGSGNIGIGQMALNNSGTIDANQSTALILQISNGVTNSGMLEATGGGTLEVAGGTYNNTGGTIQAGPGSTVQIRSNATINGGTITQSGGTLEFSNATTINAEILNPANGGQVVIDNGAGVTLGAGSSLINAGTISMNSTGTPTDLILASPNVTLSGAGTLTMSNNPGNSIGGSSSSNTLINESTIQGAGTIGTNGLVLINAGTIDANQSNSLFLQMSNGATNTGTLEATGGGTLVLSGGTYTNTGGIILASAGSTVQFSNGVTMNGGTITQTGGTLEFLNGTADTINAEILNFANAGQVQIDTGATVILGTGSNISNAGMITMNSTGAGTFLIIGAANVTLSGAGTLTMSNNLDNFIEGSAASNTFTNQSTIQGSGNIGDAKMALNNSGTIDANQTVALSLQISNGATNSGTLEATNGATLMLLGGTYSNSGTGTFLATGTNSQVVLDGTTVSGGTLASSAGGQIVAEFFSTLNGVTISSGTAVNVADGQVLNLGAGTITNNGAINLESSGDSTELAINGVTTLAGMGSVTMTANTNNLILGGGTLNNQETIQGAGNIGQAGLILNNSGTINANQSAALTIQIENGATNSGILEATNGGTLVLLGGTYNNTGGMIQAGAGSTVQFSNGVTINGGTVTQTGGTLEFQSGTTTTINAELLNPANGGQAEIDNGASLTLGAGSSINNAGTMTMNSAGSQTFLYIGAANVTLSGTGTFTMSNSMDNFIVGTAASNMLTNQSTIQGAGDIGLGSMALNNSGTIDANQPAGLILQISNGATNTGTLEASNGATLTFAGGTYANTGGTILNAASTILFDGGVTINGGTITQTGAGTIQLSNATINTALGNSSTSTIEVIGGTDNTIGGALTNPSGGQVKIDDGGELVLGSNVSNAGMITMNSSGEETELIIGASVTLSGAGTLTMSNSIDNSILGAVGSDTLTNQSTIQGAGNIGGGQMALNNSGTINANQSASLTLQISNGATNTGLLEATSGATLILAGGIYTNTGAGTILATGTNSTVVLSGTTIIGGTLTGSAGGEFLAEYGSTLNGVTISSGTALNLGDGQVVNLAAGTITNKGTINIGSSGDSTQLAINGNVTLAGTGSVILSDNANNFILGSGTLTNQNTIAGEGNIGDGEIGLVNTGSLLANEKTASTLFIDTSAAGFSNSSATKNGVLNVGAKNTVIIESGPFNNFSGGTLTGGTYIVAGTLEFNAAAVGIVTNQAAITLSGAKALIIDTSDSANALASFANNGTNGIFTVNGATFNDANVFTNSGTLAVAAGGKFNASTQLTNFNGTTSTLTGGNYNLTATGQLQFNNMGDSSDIVTNDANITLAGADTTKSSIIDQTGANALANFATNGSTGSFTLTTNRNFTTGGSFSNAGIVDVQKSTGTGITKLIVNGNYAQTGGTTTVDGVLSSSTGINVFGGFIYGSAAGITNGTQGTLVGNFNLTGGTINPGDGIKKIGDLTISGTYAESGAGILNIDLDGTTPNTKYDVLNVTGAATLGGTLDVDTLTGFTLAVDDSFDILNYASETGTFTTVNLPTLTGGETWNISYNATDLVITVEASAVSKGTVSATPAHRVSRTFDESSTAKTHEPIAILSRATCFAARMIGSASCGDKTSVVAASQGGDIHEVASVHTGLNSVHDSVMVASRSILSGRGGASHETSTSTTAMAKLYACAYLPSTVGHAMGCN
ncbi:MAG TPA: hypothetical protein VN875_18280 [Candidatus Binatus sp.]|nr:hypothetical protein [Candidatus Binatus sp.]